MQTLCVSSTDMLIPRLIKTDVFFAPGIDKRVNKNLNNLITNKPISEIEKLIWRAGSILLAALKHPEIYWLEKEEISSYF